MQVAVLSVKESGVFIPNKLKTNFDASNLFTKSKFSIRNLKMCAKSCDGTYHTVNNDLMREVSNNGNATHTALSLLISNLSINDDMHGKRYIIYQDGNQYFLLGDTVTALKKLSDIS